MRNSISKACVGLAFLCMTPATGFAEEKSYVCAITEVYECVTVTGCSRISLEDANVAGIMLLDLASVASPRDSVTAAIIRRRGLRMAKAFLHDLGRDAEPATGHPVDAPARIEMAERVK